MNTIGISIKKIVKENLAIIVILALFLTLFITWYSEAMVTNKYLSQCRIQRLFEHYEQFQYDFPAFARQTLQIPQGDTESQWSSFFYLLPIYLISNLSGGLTLDILFIYNGIIGSLLLVLFYYTGQIYFGHKPAVIGSFFMSISPWFHEIVMAPTFHLSSILMGLILFFLILGTVKKDSLIYPFLLGISTVVALYYYSPLRFLAPVVFLCPLLKKNRQPMTVLTYLTGVGVTLIVVYIFSSSLHLPFDEEHIFYTEPEHDVLLIKLKENLVAFTRAVLGFNIVSGHAPIMGWILAGLFWLGAGVMVANWQRRSMAILFFYSCLIMITPVLITAFHYQVRRYLLYTIPIYMAIGIGSGYLLETIGKVKQNRYRNVLHMAAAGVALWVGTSNLLFLKHDLYTNQKDTGFLRVAKSLGNPDKTQAIYYLQETPGSFIQYGTEHQLIRLALNKSCTDCRVKRIQNMDQIRIRQSGYLIVSPLIPEPLLPSGDTHSFINYNKIKSIAVNSDDRKYRGKAFRIYALSTN